MHNMSSHKPVVDSRSPTHDGGRHAEMLHACIAAAGVGDDWKGLTS